MSAKMKGQFITSDVLRSKALEFGSRDAVKVNQRMLIDKMLARYSSDFVFCREMIQNADDADASSFHLEIFCAERSSNDAVTDRYHNSKITEIRAINNGRVFRAEDWQRVASIAEGNTNVDSVGQFGVGFFSVFALSDEPIIVSGKEYMVFIWQNTDSLTTCRHLLPVEQQDGSTSIIMRMRSTYVLNTETRLSDETKELSLKTVQRDNRGRFSTSNITPTLNLAKLKAYFTKVLSFTKHINELSIKINGSSVFKINKTKRPRRLSSKLSPFECNSVSGMLRLGSFVQTEQEFSITGGPSMLLYHISVEATLNIDEDFHQKIQQTIKKRLPPTFRIELLFAPPAVLDEFQANAVRDADTNTRILHSLIPFKHDNDQLIPFGFLFIGLETHQSSGIGMHIFSHFIPTIERENLDLQDPYLSRWNQDLLASAGQIVRYEYDQTIRSNTSSRNSLAASLVAYSFQPSVPNKEIGIMLVDGFLSSRENILVPVAEIPSISQLSVLPSSQAYLASSEHIHKFLAVPLVPFRLLTNTLFTRLKEHGLIQSVSHDLIKSTVASCDLSVEEVIELLHWLCTDEVKNEKRFIERILSFILFHDDEASSKIMENVKFYDGFNVPTILPLPINVLPTRLARHISNDDLHQKLSLTALTLDSLLDFYLHEDQRFLWGSQTTVVCLFNLISKYWSQLDKSKREAMKNTLSNIKCVPTTQGMKIPKEAYIRSPILSSDLALIELSVVKSMDEVDVHATAISSGRTTTLVEASDNRVLAEFLKNLGCRTINIQSFVGNHKAKSNALSPSKNRLQMLVQLLVDEFDNLSEADIEAIKYTECFPGTTLSASKRSNLQYSASVLHFPWVAQKLKSDTVLILDWLDLDNDSSAYTVLWKIGVREFPVLGELVEMINHQHETQLRENPVNAYQIPHALPFLAKYLLKSYPELLSADKVTYAFLPARLVTSVANRKDGVNHDRIVLMPVNRIFKCINPLSAYPLARVVDLFKGHCDLSSLGVKDQPTLTTAFEILIERKNEILRSHDWTCAVFSYLKKIDGLNVQFKEGIAKLAFIPLAGTTDLMKPSQVFIRQNDPTLSPQLSDHGSNSRGSMNQFDTSGIIDYVDFGPDANSFLLDIGVCPAPSVSMLAELLLDRQANFFQNSGSQDQTKIRVYLHCLTMLATQIDKNVPILTRPLERRLRNEPWCLGCQYRPKNTNTNTYQIVNPKEIYLVDDVNFANDFQPLCPPDNQRSLSVLYEKFGSQWLSKCVRCELANLGTPSETPRTNKLNKLILRRLDLLFVDKQSKKKDGLRIDQVECMRKTLKVYEVPTIQFRYIFRGKIITKDASRTASCVINEEDGKIVLYIRSDQVDIQYYDVAKQIAFLVLDQPSDDTIISISFKLSTSLEELKRIGFPVKQLLKSLQENDDDTQIASQAVMKTATSIVTNSNNNFASDADVEDALRHGRIISNIVRPESRRFRRDTIPITIETSLNQEPYIDTKQRITDFRNQIEIDHVSDVNDIISYVQPYLEPMMIIPKEPGVSTIPDCSCLAPPDVPMTRYKDVFAGISLYIEDGVNVTKSMLNRATRLATIIAGLASEVYKLPIETMHLYRDVNGARVAFNHRNSLFINLRYFEQVFADRFDSETHASAALNPTSENIGNFYFMVICHLLTHNKYRNHDATFIRHLEEIVIKFLPAQGLFLPLIPYC